MVAFLVRHFEVVILAFLMAAAFIISSGRTKKREAYAKKLMKKAVESNLNEPMTLHPEIDPALCAGCGGCTKVCPEGDVLQMIKGKAVLVAPSKCVGHGLCEAACPFDAISLVFGTSKRGMDIPRVSAQYETNVSGLYIAGELGGMGLIRNAIKQGTMAAQHALKNLKVVKADYDILIIGAGPAGLAASLCAIALKKKYICIDQNTFGGTIANFPRQKVVMSQPAELPIVGKMKFKSNKVSKEELLSYWSDVRKNTGLKVKENCRFENLEKLEDHFSVKTSTGTFTAQKVILAMGVRGTPRRLGLPNEDLAKVTYNLLDPEQYQNQAVAVVGGGNAGVEAAQYLAKANLNNKVTLLVRGSEFDRCNEENQKIILDLQKKGRVTICFNSSVKEIHENELVVKKGEQVETIKNEYLFIFAGAEVPFKFLMSLGVSIDKKFGEVAKKAVA